MLADIHVWLLGLAGLAYISAALIRWRDLARASNPKRPWGLLILGIVAHLASCLISFLFSGGADFAYASLGSLLAALAMLIGTRFMSLSSPGLLLLPVGVMAIVVAVFALIDRSHLGRNMDQRSLVFYVHIIFMAANMAAILLAAASAGMYLVVSRQLKAASNRALRLPQLPPLGALAQRSLLVALAMLLGGMVSGAVAIGPESHFSLFHPTIILAGLALLMVTIALLARASQRISDRGLCWATLAILGLEVAVVVTLMAVPPHG
ncbi:MAG: hypothetical protein EA402_14830 [Planctomycetota bacterium]|nr:MAG: hypothetical protein EA402_14830 [Planctomycetota bacterium]